MHVFYKNVHSDSFLVRTGRFRARAGRKGILEIRFLRLKIRCGQKRLVYLLIPRYG